MTDTLCTPEEEAQARALCCAHGFNPDAVVSPYAPEMGPRGWYYVQDAERCRPAWSLFIYDLRAAKALLATEKSA